MGMSMSKIWTVRGISDDIQKRASEAAQAAGMRLGPFVERILLDALERLERPEGQGAPAGQGGAGDLAALVAAISTTVDAHAEAIHVLFEHRRQDFPAIVERLERLEAQVGAAIPSLPSGDVAEGRGPAAIPGRQGSAPDAVELAEGVEVPAKAEPLSGSFGEVGEVFVVGGSGSRRRLTPAGIAKVERMIRAGVGDAEIAGRIGMDRGAIRQRRLKLSNLDRTDKAI